MKIVRVLAVAGAILAGGLSVSGTPASATPLRSDALAAAAALNDSQVAYARHRGYRRYYAPRRFYRPYRVYRPYRAYRPFVYRPRVVCRIRYGYYGPRRVCVRRW